MSLDADNAQASTIASTRGHRGGSHLWISGLIASSQGKEVSR